MKNGRVVNATLGFSGEMLARPASTLGASSITSNNVFLLLFQAVLTQDVPIVYRIVQSWQIRLKHMQH